MWNKLRLAIGCSLMRTGHRIIPKYDRECIDGVVNLGVMTAHEIMKQAQQPGPDIRAPEQPAHESPAPSLLVDRMPTQEEVDELLSSGRSMPEIIAFWESLHRVRTN